jgi:hypothetical protein
VGGNPLTNRGTLEAMGGGALLLEGAWTNEGTLQAQDSSLELGGSYRTADLGSVQRTRGTTRLTGTIDNEGRTFSLPWTGSGGQVELAGTLRNAGGSLVLNGATGSARIRGGGTIVGGTVSTSEGARLVVEQGVLDGVTVNGELDLISGSVRVKNGLVLDGTAFIGGDNYRAGYMDFEGTQSLLGTGTVIFGSDYYCSRIGAGSSEITLTIGAGITIRGGNGSVGYTSCAGGYSDVAVVNLGRISADIPERKIHVGGIPLANRGTLEAMGGGALLLEGAWTNEGTLRAQDSSLELGGSYRTADLGSVQRTGGTTRLTGTIDNEGRTFNLPWTGSGGQVELTGTLRNAGGSLVLNGATGSARMRGGGTIVGGTVSTSEGARLVIEQGVLDAVTVNGELDLISGSVRVKNGLVLDGTAFIGGDNYRAGYMDFEGTQSLLGTGTVVFGSDYYCSRIGAGSSETTLTIGAGITIRGGNGSVGYTSCAGGYSDVALVNLGLISADTQDRTIHVGGRPFTNNGQIEMKNGGTLVIYAP